MFKRKPKPTTNSAADTASDVARILAAMNTTLTAPSK